MNKKTTFTFSRLKQQKRQFSANDQFDTLAGLQSVDPKEEAKFNRVCKEGKDQTVPNTECCYC